MQVRQSESLATSQSLTKGHGPLLGTERSVMAT